MKEIEDYIQFNDVHDVKDWHPYIGQYAAFGGHGILDGLKDPIYKSECYKIIGISKDRLFLKCYKGRILLSLPQSAWKQTIRIYTKQGFNKLKKDSNETFVKGL